MALTSKKSKKKKHAAGSRVEDYYISCDLNKTASREENLHKLRNKFAKYQEMASEGAVNGEEIQQQIREMSEKFRAAIRIFSNPERYKTYNEELQRAYEYNMVDVAAAKVSAEFLDEMERLYVAGNYEQIIRKCLNEINGGAQNVKVYMWLARAYSMLKKIPETLNAVENGLKIDSKNIDLLRIGSRVFTDDLRNYDKAQTVINTMMNINASAGTAEQANLYYSFDKDEAADRLIGEYTAAHPYDQNFKINCAQDLIGQANKCWEPFIPQGSSGVQGYCLTSERAYKKCLRRTEKAAQLYPSEMTKKELDEVRKFGVVTFNEENKQSLFYCTLSGVIYTILAVVGIFVTAGDETMSRVFYFLLAGSLAGLSWFIVFRLRQVSYRPQWQIMRHTIYGERMPEEKRFIVIGGILSGFIKWSFKFGWKLVKFSFRLGLR